MKDFFRCFRSPTREVVAPEQPGPSAPRENEPLPAFIKRVNFDDQQVQVLEFEAVGMAGVRANSGHVPQSRFQSVAFGTVNQGGDVQVGTSPVVLSIPPSAIQFPMGESSLSNQNQRGSQVPTESIRFLSEFNLGGKGESRGDRS